MKYIWRFITFLWYLFIQFIFAPVIGLALNVIWILWDLSIKNLPFRMSHFLGFEIPVSSTLYAVMPDKYSKVYRNAWHYLINKQTPKKYD